MFNTKMSNKAVTKLVVTNVVQWSTSFTVGAIIHATSPATNNTAQKVKLVVGSYAIGAMVAEQAANWTDRQIDEVSDAISSIKNKNTDPSE